MRASYLAEDRPEIRFAAKEAARWMSTPRTPGMEAVKRIARFLKGAPRLVQRMRRQPRVSKASGWSDSDAAGCKRTRKSTTCCILMHGDHLIKVISATQRPISWSSGEAEWYAFARSGTAVIGMINMAADFGRKLDGVLIGDATAAAGIAARRGVGKIRHLDVATLWLQNELTKGSLTVKRIPGTDNIADIGTKHLDKKVMMKHLSRCGFYVATGSSSLALKAAL